MQQDSSEPLPEKAVKTKKEDLQDSLSLFGEDKDDFDFDERIEYELKFSKEVTGNLLRTSRIVTIATLTLQGYEEIPNSKADSVTYKLVKHPLASSEVIKAFQGILKTYSDESNVVGKTDWESFSIQAMSDWKAFYKLCLKEKASPEKFQRTVYRIFQDCILNIGKIVCDNPGNMDKLFGKINDNAREDDIRNVYKP